MNKSEMKPEPRPYLTLVEFRNKQGGIDCVKEVVYDGDLPCFRKAFNRLAPLTEKDLNRSGYYRDSKGALQWAACIMNLAGKGLFDKDAE